MSKKKAFANPVLQKKGAVEKASGFNLVTENRASAFESVFRDLPLSDREEGAIENLLKVNYVDSELTESDLRKDVTDVKNLTREIKAITNQGAFLIGERVAKVREILKRYKKETFGSWLEEIFGNRRTGYNFLAYYELWEDLPNQEIKNKYQAMPRKPAYMLASRTVGIKEKITFIDKFFNLKANKIILELRKLFPSPRPTKREPFLLAEIRTLVERFSEEGPNLSREDLEDLKVIKKAIGKASMKYLINPKPKKVALNGAKKPNFKHLIEEAAFSGERFILQDKDKAAALVPLEDLALLEKSESS